MSREAHTPLFRVADLFALTPFLAEDQSTRFEMLVQPYATTIDTRWSTEHALAKINQRLLGLKSGMILSELYRVRAYNFFARFLPLSTIGHVVFKRLLKTNITTTNPGPVQVPFENFGSFHISEFINFPQISPPARLGVIYTTFRGQLRLIILYDNTLYTSQHIDTLSDELWSEVNEVTSELRRSESR